MRNTIDREGNQLYTNTEYDHLSGYVERTYTTTWRDAEGTLWRKTCQVVNLGRPDRGIVVDPDEAMTPDPWPRELRTWQGAGSDEIRRQKRVRDTQIHLEIVAYLTEHGPQHVQMLVSECGYNRSTLDPFMREREGTVFVRAGRVGKATLWGVRGIHKSIYGEGN
jgi:hypothetical protein